MIRAYLTWVTFRAAGRALRTAVKVAAAVAALLAATPATVVAAYSYTIAWLLGWPPRRLFRAAAWCLPMLAVWVIAQELRTGRWGAAWREPFGAWRQIPEMQRFVDAPQQRRFCRCDLVCPHRDRPRGVYFRH